MKIYYDTGLLLKLYTNEPESDQVREFVTDRNEPLFLNSIHKAEFVSAFQLKVFRKELTSEAAKNSINDFEDDLNTGVLRMVEIDWHNAWSLCNELARAHSASTGCRTLDTLHIACARTLALRIIATSDRRQRSLATQIGMTVLNPVQSI
jgi:predicted nucleic acid-binding protein